MLCIPNCSALSQPQLYHFKSLATELFIYGPCSTDCTAKPFVRRNSAQRAFYLLWLLLNCFLCSRVSSSGLKRNGSTEQMQTTKKQTTTKKKIQTADSPPAPRVVFVPGSSFTQLHAKRPVVICSAIMALPPPHLSSQSEITVLILR